MSPSELRKALQKAIRAYTNGTRYYDEKHGTYNPSSYEANILQHVSDLVGYYGVESYEPGDNFAYRPKYSYVNSGDSYRTTVVFNRITGQFRITDIGSIIEREG